MMDWSHIVVVHGVGDAKPGDTLRSLAETITESPLNRGSSYEQSDLVLRDVTYPRLKARGAVPELIEVHWSDLVRTNRSTLGVVVYFVRLIYAMLDFAERWHDDRPSFFVFLYRWFFAMTAGWTIFFSIYVMFFASFPGSYIRWLVFGVGSFLVLSATVILWCWAGKPWPFATFKQTWIWWVRRVVAQIFEPAPVKPTDGESKARPASGAPELRPMFFDGGLVWSVVFVGVGFFICLNIDADATKLLTVFSASLDEVVHAGISVLSMSAAVDVLCVRAGDRLSWLARLTRLAFLYVPMIALSIAGSFLRAACLIPAKYGENYRCWETWYLESLPGDLKFSEFVMGIAIGGIGCLALFALACYAWRRWSWGNYDKSGPGVRYWIVAILIICPLILFGAGILIYCHNHWGHRLNTADILDVYRISALRIIPYFSYAVPGIGIVLSVAADVVFFLLPSSHPFGIQEKAKEQVKNLLEFIQSGSPDNKILVISHSQGSVIAVTVLDRSYSHVEFVTLGSPLDSLYKRFLDWQQPNAPPTWDNYYRFGDYIGGKIDSTPPGDNSVPDPKGGHVNYWSDKKIMKAVLRIG